MCACCGGAADKTTCVQVGSFEWWQQPAGQRKQHEMQPVELRVATEDMRVGTHRRNNRQPATAQSWRLEHDGMTHNALGNMGIGLPGK